jgi:hypothetical protein
MTADHENVLFASPTFKASRKLYLPIDGSKAANDVMEWALKTLFKRDDLITLVHVRAVHTCKVLAETGLFSRLTPG